MLINALITTVRTLNGNKAVFFQLKTCTSRKTKAYLPQSSTATEADNLLPHISKSK